MSATPKREPLTISIMRPRPPESDDGAPPAGAADRSA
jgi:hypothetical protein